MVPGPLSLPVSLLSLPLQAHGFHFCPQIKSPSAFLLQGHLPLELGLTQVIQEELLISRSLITSAKTFFSPQIRPHSQVPGMRTWTNLGVVVGGTIQPPPLFLGHTFLVWELQTIIVPTSGTAKTK